MSSVLSIPREEPRHQTLLRRDHPVVQEEQVDHTEVRWVAVLNRTHRVAQSRDQDSELMLEQVGSMTREAQLTRHHRSTTSLQALKVLEKKPKEMTHKGSEFQHRYPQKSKRTPISSSLRCRHFCLVKIQLHLTQGQSS